jgi:hypothetical protein
MLVYGAAMTQFWMVFWIVVSIISFIFWLLYLVAADTDHAPGKIICGLLMLGAFSIAGLNYGELMKIDKAPKLYIMQEMASQARHAQCNQK